MNWLIEQVGGKRPSLDIKPDKRRERMSVFMGSKNDVNHVSRYHSQA